MLASLLSNFMTVIAYVVLTTFAATMFGGAAYAYRKKEYMILGLFFVIGVMTLTILVIKIIQSFTI